MSNSTTLMNVKPPTWSILTILTIKPPMSCETNTNGRLEDFSFECQPSVSHSEAELLTFTLLSRSTRS